MFTQILHPVGCMALTFLVALVRVALLLVLIVVVVAWTGPWSDLPK